MVSKELFNILSNFFVGNFTLASKVRKINMVVSLFQAIYKLGQFEIEDTVSDETSHLVTMDNNRTMNILRGIIRGIWILSFDWITASLAADRWLYEEPFEFLECSPVIQVLKIPKTNFGMIYFNGKF